jgi:hypothetical protein
MTKGVLVDAGPLIAIVDRNDQDHDRCVAAMKRLRHPLLTTWMPVTEAMHLMAFSLTGQEALLEMIQRGAPRVLPVEEDDVPGIRALMRKYADLPMDFADATLVQAAMRHRLREIFTLDTRDFSVYRIGPRKSFNIISA